MGGCGSPRWEAHLSGRPWEAKVGGPSERPKCEAKVRGHGRPWEAKVGSHGRPKWEAVGGRSGRPKWEAVGGRGGRTK